MIEELSVALHEYQLETNCILNNFVLANVEVFIGDPTIVEQSLVRNGDILCPQMEVLLITDLPLSVLRIDGSTLKVTGAEA